MESPQIHRGPIKNRETSPGGQITGQNCNDLTDHNQQTTGEADLGQSGKKTKKRRTKKKVTNKPSQETEVTPIDSLNGSKEPKLKGEKLTSEKNVPISHPHVSDAGQAWTTQDGIGQHVPRRYNLRNASAPVSYARFSTRWKRRNGREDKYYSRDGSCSLETPKRQGASRTTK